MEQEVIVLFVRPYSFKNDEGQQMDGVTVYYINKNATSTEKDGFGYLPVKASIENAKDLTHLPGRYKAFFTVNPTSRGMQLKLSGFEFIDKVDIWENK